MLPSQLDLEDHSPAIRSAISRRAPEIALFVERRSTDREQAIDTTGEGIKLCVVPAIAGGA